MLMSCQDTKDTGTDIGSCRLCRRNPSEYLLIYSVVYGLFNDTFIKSDYIGSSGRMGSE